VEHLFLISTAGLLQTIQSDENFGGMTPIAGAAFSRECIAPEGAPSEISPLTPII
jgi:hypothetical protein